MFTNEDLTKLIDYLYSIKDIKYKEFNDKIIKTNYETIGVRMPTLKSISKKISKYDLEGFIKIGIKSNIYEILMLVGLVISNIKDINIYDVYINEFVKVMDSWCFTDTISKNSKVLNTTNINYAYSFIKSESEFTKRYGYVLILDHYINKDNLEVIFNLIKKEKVHSYYVDMAISWLLSELYIKYKSETYSFISNTKLSDFILKMTIRKIKDSYRVSAKDKEILNELV